MSTFAAGTSHCPDRRELAARAANGCGAGAILARHKPAPLRPGSQYRTITDGLRRARCPPAHTVPANSRSPA